MRALIKLFAGVTLFAGLILSPAHAQTSPLSLVGVPDDLNLECDDNIPSPASVTAETSCDGVQGITFVRSFSNLGNGNGIAVSSVGNIYVANDQHNIKVFNATGGLINTWGSFGSGDGQFRRPAQLSFDSSDNLYVADLDNSRVQVFDSLGNFLFKFGGLSGAVGLGLDPTNDNILVADRNNHRIRVFDALGNYISDIGSFGSGPGQFNVPGSVEVDSTGRIFVSDLNGNRVQAFDAAGAYLFEVASAGTVSFPRDMAIDDQDRLFVADTGNHRILIYDRDGNQLYSFGSNGTGDGQFVNPHGIDVVDGKMYVVDANQRTQVFKLPGPSVAFEFSFNNRGNGNGVAVSSAGLIYVANDENNIMVFDATGNVVNVWGGSGIADGQFRRPAQLSIDSSDNIYVADLMNNRVQVFNSLGIFLFKFGDVSQAIGVGLDPTNDNILVADRNNHRIRIYDALGNHIADFGSFGSGPGQFNVPGSVEVDSTGRIFVSDLNPGRIQAFNAAGNFLFEIAGVGDVSFPRDMAIDDQDRLFVVDTGNHRVLVFDRDGNALFSFGSNGTGNGQFNSPHGITVVNGKVYVVDGTRRTQIFSLSLELPVTFSESIEGDCPTIITRTWSAEDDCGNTAEESQVITVEDTQAPLLIGVPEDESVDCGALPEPADVTAEDACDPDPVVEMTEVVETADAGGYVGPLPYLSEADSPYNGLSLNYFHLENFEDGFNVPGVTIEYGVIDPSPFPGSSVDSVDGDDGVIDGDGSSGTDWYIAHQSNREEFYFDAGVLGDLPTHVGVVWTDVGASSPVDMYGDVLVEAFDSSGVSLGVQGPYAVGDGSGYGETAEDRFIGVVHLDGISRFSIWMPQSSDWSFDHLQYGRGGVSSCDGSYTIVRTWVAADACGNDTSASQRITVSDTTPPELIGVPDDATVECGRVLAEANVIAIDDCGGGTAGAVSFIRSFSNLGNGNGVGVSSAGNIYVANDEHNIKVFNATGGLLNAWGSFGSGDGQFRRPAQLSFDSSDNLYVADLDNSRVQVFDSLGNFLFAFGGVSQATGVGLDPTNDNILVGDRNNHRIRIYDALGNHLSDIGSLGAGPGQFNVPGSVEVDSTGRIFVSDLNPGRIQAFDPAGSFLFEVAGAGDVAFPRDMAIDDQDRLFAVDTGNHRVLVFDRDGNALFSFGNNGTGDGEFIDPHGITVVDGKVYVVDVTQRTQIFALSSELPVAFSESVEGDCPTTITRTWSAEDSCGNKTEESQVITVVDTQGPEMDCPQEIVLAADPTCGTDVDCCTYGFGYWKNHFDSWPLTSIEMGGVVYTAQEALEIMWTPPRGDATYILAHHLITAKLNADGLCGGDTTWLVGEIIGTADLWLGANPLGSRPGEPMKSLGLTYKDGLEDYNEGLIEPEACHDAGETESAAVGCTTLPDITGEVAADDCHEVTVVQSPEPGQLVIEGETVNVTVTATDSCGNESDCAIPVRLPVEGGVGEDNDGDGVINLDELIAGTDLLVPEDRFEFYNIEGGGTGCMIRWRSAANRLYRIEKTTDGSTYTVVESGIIGTPPVNEYVDDTPIPDGACGSYRVFAE